jgi:hypothetical protein
MHFHPFFSTRTFPLANEPFDEPPELLGQAVEMEREKNGEEIDFISIPHGTSVESKSQVNML